MYKLLIQYVNIFKPPKRFANNRPYLLDLSQVTYIFVDPRMQNSHHGLKLIPMSQIILRKLFQELEQ
jgi:hypothetical protein